MSKKTYTTSLNVELIKKFKVYCAVNDVHQNKVIEDFLLGLLAEDDEEISTVTQVSEDTSPSEEIIEVKEVTTNSNEVKNQLISDNSNTHNDSYIEESVALSDKEEELLKSVY